MCSDVFLIELECNHCKLQFHICRKCYRGHVYCSSSCRREAQCSAGESNKFQINLTVTRDNELGTV